MAGRAAPDIRRLRFAVKMGVQNLVRTAMRRPDLGHRHLVAAVEMREHANPFAFGFGAGFFLNLPLLGADRAVHVGANELMVFNAAPVAIEGHAHAFARAVAHQ